MTKIRIIDSNYSCRNKLVGRVFDATTNMVGAELTTRALNEQGCYMDSVSDLDQTWFFAQEDYEIVDEQLEAHIFKLESAPTAASILQAGLSHMEDRAATYDNDEGERSIPATVAAFNAITGHELTSEHGWLFMSVLKMVRSQQGEFKLDNYEDLAAYAGLMGEQATKDRGTD